MSTIPPTLQTVYAELLERAATAAFDESFAEDGGFVSKTIKGRRYWYFQKKGGTSRKQTYVGPETEELLEHIRRHQEPRDDRNERATLVSTLVRSAHLPRPPTEISEVITALAKAGVFRLRGVLIGSMAYQTYSAMLGVKLPTAAGQTGDVDIAQFTDVSIAVEDKIPPILDVLREADKSFREVPHSSDSRRTVSYQASSGVRVDFLTPNRGRDDEKPRSLPAFNTDAQPLRFLDYLIRDPEPAVVLHGPGIYVLVPAPQKYALHKLIVARRRNIGSIKRSKDIQQADALLAVLVEHRPYELRQAWTEAFERGPTWRQLVGEGLGLLHVGVRDPVLKTVGVPRSAVPGLTIEFARGPARYDSGRDVASFVAQASNPLHPDPALVRCAVSREALEDHFDADGLEKDGRLEKFRENRALFEEMARFKYLEWPVEEPGQVLIGTEDVPKLLMQIPKARRTKRK